MAEWTGSRWEWFQMNTPPTPANLTWNGRVLWRVESVEDSWPGEDSTFKARARWCVRRAKEFDLPELCLASCGWVESTYNSKAVGDGGHSFGLCQQNPRWWGKGATREERVNDLLKAEKNAQYFLEAMLRAKPNWYDGGEISDKALGDWIQSVQRSSYPNAYQEKMNTVRKVLNGDIDKFLKGEADDEDSE